MTLNVKSCYLAAVLTMGVPLSYAGDDFVMGGACAKCSDLEFNISAKHPSAVWGWVMERVFGRAGSLEPMHIGADAVPERSYDYGIDVSPDGVRLGVYYEF